MSDKIKPHHLERKAILYIRQSTAYQVSHNLESQKLQYAMQDRLQQLGWREIEVVDEDLGRSAAGTVTRAGFERIVRKCVWAKWVRWPLGKCLASRATAGSGNNWWKSAESHRAARQYRQCVSAYPPASGAAADAPALNTIACSSRYQATNRPQIRTDHGVA
jgi:hypothetical protein